MGKKAPKLASSAEPALLSLPGWGIRTARPYGIAGLAFSTGTSPTSSNPPEEYR